jgi:hypothetical protein
MYDIGFLEFSVGEVSCGVWVEVLDCGISVGG